MDFYHHPTLVRAFELYMEEENARLPDDEELAKITFSPEFEERMRKMFARRKYGYYTLFGTVGRRIASVSVALLLTATILTASVEAIRTPVVQFFTEVYEKFTQIFVTDDTPDAPGLVFEPHAPTYIPEGYVVEKEEKHASAYYVTYTNDAGKRISFQQQVKDGNYQTIDTENIPHTNITIGEYEGIVYTNKGKTFLILTDEKYAYAISSILGEEELIKIAESITKS